MVRFGIVPIRSHDAADVSAGCRDGSWSASAPGSPTQKNAMTAVVHVANLIFIWSPLLTGNAFEHQLDGSLLATLVDLDHVDGHGVAVYPSDTLIEDLAIHLGNDVDRVIIDDGFRVRNRRLGAVDLK